MSRKRPATREPESHHSHSPASSFVCCHCKSSIPIQAVGTNHRNHCPVCLWSLHLDMKPGDRKSACQSPMRPIAVSLRENGEWMIVHQCTGCGVIRVNRIAGDDQEFALLSLAAKPLSKPPFPLISMEAYD
jgi:hypothetical protein